MGGWPEAERWQGSPEPICLHSTMQEQLGLICLWSLSGNPSQVERRQNWGNRWHSVLASGSLWPACIQQGALLLSAPLPRVSLPLVCVCHSGEVNFIQQNC